ncbi:hypothetical protein BH09PAT2_BH09PAT2_06850 [soil metagenome]
MTEKSTKKHIIEMRGIVKLFKVKLQDILVLKKVDLDIYSSDFIIIFGPSGCGKSTLLHAILGLEEPSGGTVNFLNQDLYTMNEDGRSQFRKNNIGMVYQQSNWIKSLNVLENIAFSPSLKGLEKSESMSRAQNALKEVGMEDWANYYPTELSSGQQQKISFARAIATDPEVIIADEPTGNLDYRSGIDLMNLFKKNNEQGKTIIMVTHDPDSIEYATKVVQMFDGKIVEIHAITKSNFVAVKRKLIERKSLHVAIEKDNLENAKLIKEYKIKDTDNSVTKKSRFQFSIPSRESIRTSITNSIQTTALLFKNSKKIFLFVALLFIYLTSKLVTWLYEKHWIPSFISSLLGPIVVSTYNKMINALQNKHHKSISQLELIDLSLRNMLVRKARSVITIGGMAIGIASIVFLVSLGYGLEKLIITRVARLDEMKQIDAIPAVSSNIRITDKTLAQIKKINTIKKVLPVIGLVGKVNFSNSNTDVAVYGVVGDYLKESAIRPAEGKIFASNRGFNIYPSNTGQARVDRLLKEQTSGKGQVAGVSTQKANIIYKQEIQARDFRILPDTFIRVRSQPRVGENVLGYSRRIEGIQGGKETWGNDYPDTPAGEAGTDHDGKKMGKWIQAKVPLWEKIPCSPDNNPSCEKNEYIPLLDDGGSQLFKDGYFAEIDLQFIDVGHGAVLGIASDSPSVSVKTASTSADLLTLTTAESTDEADILINKLLDDKSTQALHKVDLKENSNRVAVVNRSFLRVLGISTEGVGKKFSISFIATGSLVENNERIESQPTEYEIIGVTPDTKTPIVYVPLVDLNELGLGNYSQIKIVLDNQNQVAQTRKQIEVLGLTTSSVVDTVAQIEGFFSTVRLLLGLLGFVALSVAALGMFNTLTISLMERTHEVGMMKAIGMKSDEVKDLFLTESMIMGVFGGIGGLLLGALFGTVLSLLISSVSIVRGYGYLNITFIPFLFILLIIVISLVVGLATGIYPARRATKISALDALRYE